jgi:hypothetical protein
MFNAENIRFLLSYTEKKTLETYHNRHNSKTVSLRDLGSSPLFIISYDLVTGLKVKDYLDLWLCYYSNSETIIDTEKVLSYDDYDMSRVFFFLCNLAKKKCYKNYKKVFSLEMGNFVLSLGYSLTFI